MTRELFSPSWLEDSIDKVVAEEVSNDGVDKDAFAESVRIQLEEYSKEMGGAISHESVSDETVLQKRVINLKALKIARKY